MRRSVKPSCLEVTTQRIICMNRTDFYFDSRDNESRIHAVKWVPDTDPVGILILVHGMAEYIGRYEAFAQYMCEQGFVVAGNDHLGHGDSVGSNPCGYFCKRDPATVVVRDVHRLKKMIQSEYPELPVFLFGHSMGSLIARNYLTRYGSGINGAVICGTLMMPKALLCGMGVICSVLKLFQGSKHPSVVMNSIGFGSYCKRIENPRTPFDWLTKDDSIIDAYIDDPKCGFLFTINGFMTLKEILYRLHDRNALEKIPKDLPVLFIYGSEDPCGEYGVAVRKVYEQYRELGIKDVTEKCYENDRHELLNETDKAKVMEDIHSWICERI